MSNSPKLSKKLGCLLKSGFSSSLTSVALIFLSVYRSLFTSWLGGGCRFEPSCSDYAVQAFHAHAPYIATCLVFRRLCQCRPGGPCGYDPIPMSLEPHESA